MIEVFTSEYDDVWFALALSKKQIVTTTFNINQKTVLTSILNNLPFNTPFQVFHEPRGQANTALLALKDIYDGKDPQTKLSLAITKLPAYTQKVIKATLAIPVGFVTSYGAIAEAVDGGARAVGNIMAGNLFPPIVPCHRVVKSDWSLGGYGGGLKLKTELLSREKRGFAKKMEVKVNGGGTLPVFPVEHVLEKCKL